MQLAGMIQAATAGHFAVDPGTGAELMRSLTQMREGLKTLRADAHQLDRETPLGDLPEAQAVSDLNRQVAAGDPQSLISVLLQFESSLEQAHAAVQLGMANYEQVEAQLRETYDRGLRERAENPATGSVLHA